MEQEKPELKDKKKKVQSPKTQLAVVSDYVESSGESFLGGLEEVVAEITIVETVSDVASGVFEVVGDIIGGIVDS